jgi:hypothetical protein
MLFLSCSPTARRCEEKNRKKPRDIGLFFLVYATFRCFSSKVSRHFQIGEKVENRLYKSNLINKGELNREKLSQVKFFGV